MRNSAITSDNVGFKILEETFTKIMRPLFTCKYYNGEIFFWISELFRDHNDKKLVLSH